MVDCGNFLWGVGLKGFTKVTFLLFVLYKFIMEFMIVSMFFIKKIKPPPQLSRYPKLWHNNT